MKVIYKNTELQHNTRVYADLINKPSLNGKVLVGNTTLDELSLYDKQTTEKLIKSISQIRFVAEMPADPEPSMTYYVGPNPDTELYDVVVVNDAKQQTRMGTTQFGQYKSGPGVNVKVDNTININTDTVSTYIDSEGNLASSLDGEALPAFTGATASTAGTKGLVPKPLAGQQNALLMGDSSWVDVVDYVYPVGAILLTSAATVSPNTMFAGTTWELLDAGYALLNTTDGGGVKNDTVGIPEIYGWYKICPDIISNYHDEGGAVNAERLTTEWGWTSLLNGGAFNPLGKVTYYFDASEYSPIYGNSDTVQPPALTVFAWRRTA